MGVCFDRLEKYNAFQIMNEWLPRQSETFQEQVKKKLTHKVEEYTEGSAEIYKTIFGNIPERFREEKDFREIVLHSRLIQIENQSAFFMLIFIHSQSRKKDWLLNFSRKEETI